MSHGGSAKNAKDAVIDFVAGSLGGTALVYVGQPFDTIKVKMQTFPALYTGMVNCFKQTFKNDGIAKGLYAGTLPALAANVAENAVLFAGYGFCQKFIANIMNKPTVEELSIVENASAGFLAAFGSSLVLCPTELIKCKLQATREMQKLNPDRNFKRIGPMNLTAQIIRMDGVQGLFKGLIATFIREMPGYFFFFGGYEAIRELLTHPGQSKDDIGLLRTMSAGAVGGVLFWLVMFPADVVKSRMQIRNIKDGFFTTTMGIFRKEGVMALYNGLLPTIVRTIPATGTLFVVYEYSKRAMHSIF